MNLEVTITIKPEEEKNNNFIKSLIYKELKIKGISFSKDQVILEFLKKSIDARHGKQKFHLRYKVYIGEKPTDSNNLVPQWKKSDGKHSVIIVGSGPAGLFGALKLLEYGIKPIIIERGTETIQRRKDIAAISTKNIVDENSNYCFGEGGAGTFSDGKLYTRSNKRGNINEILAIFVEFGADKKILTDAHPHIGTDKLPKVINNMRQKIIDLGGEFHFDTKVTDFIITNDDGKKTITGVQTTSCKEGQSKSFTANAVLLATGHSATDIYKLIGKISPSSLEAKTFAAGVRVEHPRELINAIQYHNSNNPNLPTAEYSVKTQVMERGVYSFCMCPGGFVVPSASGPDEIVVNGMSTAARNSAWSDAAIVVEIQPQDIPESFKKEAIAEGCEGLAGLLFRADIEKKAKLNGEGQRAPAQKLTDFLSNKKSTDLPVSSYTPGLKSSNLNEWLPSHISTRLKQGFIDFDRNMKGFISENALLIAPETRTSTPVRITRDRDDFQCTGIKNLYPSGEGSGYSGGIVSSAMDGEKSSIAIAKKILG